MEKRMNKCQLIERILNYYYCDSEDIKLIASSRMQPELRSIALEYILLKNRNYLLQKDNGLKIVSLGCNCYPHTMAIRLGFKFPKWLSLQDRLFFDLGITNVHNTIKIMTGTENEKLADDYNSTNEWFVSKKYSFLYNHDYVDNKKTKTDNLSSINNTLSNRLIETKKFLQNNSCLALIVLYKKKESLNDIYSLYKVLREINPVTRLMVIDPENLLDKFSELSKEGIFYDGTRYPNMEQTFVWFDAKSYLTKQGINYFSKVSDSINAVLQEEAISSEGELRIDPFAASKLNNEYNQLIRQILA